MKRFCLVLLLSCFLVLGLVGSGWGKVWYVKQKPEDSDVYAVTGGSEVYLETDDSDLDDLDDGPPPGESWETAFETIQEALESAYETLEPDEADEIWVAAGTYVLENSITIVGKAVGIYGGFEGKDSETQREQRDWTKNVTTVDGNNNVTCFVLSGVGTGVIIDGFTIRNGYSDSNPGGLLDYRSSPTIANCIFYDNIADNGQNGGGVVNRFSSSPTIINCIFGGNSADGDGGAIHNSVSSSPKIINSTFYENSAGGNGGAIASVSNSPPTITNCIFWGDKASEGPEIYDGPGSIADVTYSDVQGGYPGDKNIGSSPDHAPLFVDPENGDFHLQSGSPCIDAGTDMLTIGGESFALTDFTLTDFEGDPRIVGEAPDMGADEALLADYNTPEGDDVEVKLIDDVTGARVFVTFDEVTVAGTTSLAVFEEDEPPPPGFKLVEPAYYDLTTTAKFYGPVTVCIDYSEIRFDNEEDLSLFKYENGEWIEVISSLDMEMSMICGTVESLSLFAIFEFEGTRFQATLGDNRRGFFLDQDVFKFEGTKGEEVEIRLEECGNSNVGERATLILKDRIRRVRLFKLDRSALPNEITATLPATGKYLIIVAEQPRFARGKKFKGDYWLTMKSTEEAFQTLKATPWMEHSPYPPKNRDGHKADNRKRQRQIW